MLTFFQKKLVSAAITCVSIFVIFAFAAGFLFLLSEFLNYFRSVIWPLAAAAIAAVILQPFVDFLVSKFKFSPLWATISVFAILTILLASVAILALPKLSSEISAIASEVPSLLKRFGAWLAERFPNMKGYIAQKIAELEGTDISKATLNSAFGTIKNLFNTALSATSGAVGVAAFCAAFAVAPIYLFYMLTLKTDLWEKLEQNMSFLSPTTREDAVFFARRFAEIMTSFFRGQLLIAFIMGILFGTGLWIAGVKFGFLMGFIVGMLNIIPYFGTIIGLSTILPTAFFQDGGSLLLVGVSLAIFIGVQLVEAYLLTPKIMGNRTGMHPMAIIFSVFFWGVALNGILGMILAIPLSAFISAAWGRIRVRMSGNTLSDPELPQA